MAEPRTKAGWVKTSARVAIRKGNKSRNLVTERMVKGKPVTTGKRTVRPR